MPKLSVKNVLVPTLVLFTVCIITTALLGFTNEITKEPIAQAEAESSKESMMSVSPDGVKTYEKIEISDDSAECYAALGEDGSILAYAISTSAKGYGGAIKVMTGINAADGSLIAVSVFDNSDETPGLGAKTSEDKFTEQFAGDIDENGFAVAKDADKYPDSKTVDAVTGATISSRAVVSAVNQAIVIYTEVAERQGNK